MQERPVFSTVHQYWTTPDREIVTPAAIGKLSHRQLKCGTGSSFVELKLMTLEIYDKSFISRGYLVYLFYLTATALLFVLALF